MESQKKRVFAYTKATVIDKDELIKVSGGKGAAHISTKQTIRATGGSGSGADVAYDVGIDW